MTEIWSNIDVQANIWSTNKSLIKYLTLKKFLACLKFRGIIYWKSQYFKIQTIYKPVHSQRQSKEPTAPDPSLENVLTDLTLKIKSNQGSVTKFVLRISGGRMRLINCRIPSRFQSPFFSNATSLGLHSNFTDRPYRTLCVLSPWFLVLVRLFSTWSLYKKIQVWIRVVAQCLLPNRISKMS